jgi:hypothetical protein
MPNAPMPAIPEEPADPIATAAYVAELTGNLAYMARREGLETLSFILEMAKLEAENCARGGKPQR